MHYFQDMILLLKEFWSKQGCLIQEPYDMEMGAATFHPSVFFNSISSKNTKIAFIQPCRRPTDGRYGENPNRLQRYYQFQVLIKPVPENIIDIYIESLQTLGLDTSRHDLRFVHDDWESPTLGAWGLGWEILLDGMEISQYTYFQQVGGISLEVIPVEITYGLERIGMYLQKKNRIYDLEYSKDTLYGDLFLENEKQQSAYNFEYSNFKEIKSSFDFHYGESKVCLEKDLYIPAYENMIKCSHYFNLLDARGSISQTLRVKYIQDIRKLSFHIAQFFHQKNKQDVSHG